MDALDMLLSRRSIRKYGDKNVEEHKLQAMLRAAMAAPSAGNQQPWQFVVIRDRRTLDRVCEFHPYAQMCHEAALAILVCGDTGLERHEGFWVQDCSAATQNLLLAAHAQGLAPSGLASILGKSASRLCVPFFNCLMESFPSAWWPWAIRGKRSSLPIATKAHACITTHGENKNERREPP